MTTCWKICCRLSCDFCEQGHTLEEGYFYGPRPRAAFSQGGQVLKSYFKFYCCHFGVFQVGFHVTLPWRCVRDVCCLDSFLRTEIPQNTASAKNVFLVLSSLCKRLMLKLTSPNCGQSRHAKMEQHSLKESTRFNQHLGLFEWKSSKSSGM